MSHHLTFLVLLHVVREVVGVLDAHGLRLVSEDHVSQCGHGDVNAVCCCQSGVTWTIELRCWLLLATAVSPPAADTGEPPAERGSGCALESPPPTPPPLIISLSCH